MREEISSNIHPLVSIIVLNWNGIVYLRKCLQSLMNLTYPNYEIIVVDNGSSDGSLEMIETDFKSVRLITNKRNLGFAGGNNIGIRASNGNLIVLLNNDVIVHQDWLSELIKAKLDSPKIGMASGIILQSRPGDIVWSAGKKIDAFTGTSWRIGYGKKPAQIENTEDVDYFSACALLITREAIEKIGLLDEGYFLYGEDADWALTARRAGYECKLARSAIVWHEGSATSKRALKKRYYYYSFGIFRLMFKHFPLTHLFTALLFQLILLSVFEVLLFGRSADYLVRKLEAFLRNIVDLRRTIIERKKVQCSGESILKGRLRECAEMAKSRATSQYYDF